MTMGPQIVEGIEARLAAFETALLASVPSTWTVERGFVPYSERPDITLESVVLNIICEGESNYSQARGMAAKEGTLKLLLVAHIKVDELQTRNELQQEEILVMEELKTFARTGLVGMDCSLNDLQPSRMLEHPYGWVVASFEIRPPGANTH